MREELNRILVHHTGQSMEKIQRDTDRDFFMTAEQAKEYRIVNGHPIFPRWGHRKFPTPG